MTFRIVDDFFHAAGAMRRSIDGHFADPQEHKRETHQIWNYWFVPNLYTYLRTAPENIIHPSTVADFLRALESWALVNLGFGRVSEPKLSLYVDGCRQALHNDARNGRWGYVFSLTNWDTRRFSGGETLLFRNEAYWNTPRAITPIAGGGLYEAIEPRFNRLLVFDDRVIHGVERVEGTMDPAEGRIVLHGHISEGRIFVEGPLSEAIVLEHLNAFSADLTRRLERAGNSCSGALGIELRIDSKGNVGDLALLSSQLSRRGENGPAPDELTAQILELLRGAIFPAASRSSRVIFPLTLN